jgi:hypothetical protein
VLGREFVVVVNDLCELVGLAIDVALLLTLEEYLLAFGLEILETVLLGRVVFIILVVLVEVTTLERYECIGTI